MFGVFKAYNDANITLEFEWDENRNEKKYDAYNYLGSAVYLGFESVNESTAVEGRSFWSAKSVGEVVLKFIPGAIAAISMVVLLILEVIGLCIFALFAVPIEGLMSLCQKQSEECDATPKELFTFKVELLRGTLQKFMNDLFVVTGLHMKTLISSAPSDIRVRPPVATTVRTLESYKELLLGAVDREDKPALLKLIVDVAVDYSDFSPYLFFANKERADEFTKVWNFCSE